MSTDSPARPAFVGCGRHATRLLYPCLPTFAEIGLAAVCDLDEGLADRTARNYGACSWYTTFDALLENELDLDGVIVVEPP